MKTLPAHDAHVEARRTQAPRQADARLLPGGQPPPPWWLPAVMFVVPAVLLSLVIALVVRGPGPLDDPNPAYQRDGLVQSGPQLPSELAGVRFGARPVVVLFERAAPVGPRFDQWRKQVTAHGTQLVIALAGTQASSLLSQAVKLRTPRDGGAPVGYAIVDAKAQVRYATLDPAYLSNADEVLLIVAATAGAHS